MCRPDSQERGSHAGACGDEEGARLIRWPGWDYTGKQERNDLAEYFLTRDDVNELARSENMIAAMCSHLRQHPQDSYELLCSAVVEQTKQARSFIDAEVARQWERFTEPIVVSQIPERLRQDLQTPEKKE